MQVFNRYGAVTMPDLPGFGGMDSLYDLNQEATIDNLADYLAAFVKLRYKRKKVVIAGMSFGFVIATRMLQRFPELQPKVQLLISVAGFAHNEDFLFSKPRRALYLTGCTVFSTKLGSMLFRYGALNGFILRTFYHRTHNAKHKFAGLSEDERKKMTEVEVNLWQCNEVRTYMRTTIEFLRFNNCTSKIDVPAVHVGVKADHFFDNNVVEQHMRVIFDDFQIVALLDLKAHAPSIIADEKQAAPFVPAALRRKLSKLM